MTVYLLDENVLNQLRPGGNANVHKWLATVDGSDLRISAMTFFEKRNGAENKKRMDRATGERLLAAIAAVETHFAGRIVAYD